MFCVEIQYNNNYHEAIEWLDSQGLIGWRCVLNEKEFDKIVKEDGVDWGWMIVYKKPNSIYDFFSNLRSVIFDLDYTRVFLFKESSIAFGFKMRL